MPQPTSTPFEAVPIVVGDTFRDGFRLKYNSQADKDARYFWLEPDGRIGIANEAGEAVYLTLTDLFYTKAQTNALALPGAASETTAGLVRKATDAEVLAGENDSAYLTPYHAGQLLGAVFAGVPRSVQAVCTVAGQTQFSFLSSQIPPEATILQVQRPQTLSGALDKNWYTWANGVLTLSGGAILDPLRVDEYLHVLFTARMDGGAIYEALQLRVEGGNLEYRFTDMADWALAGPIVATTGGGVIKVDGVTLTAGVLTTVAVTLPTGTKVNRDNLRFFPSGTTFGHRVFLNVTESTATALKVLSPITGTGTLVLDTYTPT